MAKLYADSEDADQTPDLGLHCLPVYPFRDLPTTMG